MRRQLTTGRDSPGSKAWMLTFACGALLLSGGCLERGANLGGGSEEDPAHTTTMLHTGDPCVGLERHTEISAEAEFALDPAIVCETYPGGGVAHEYIRVGGDYTVHITRRLSGEILSLETILDGKVERETTYHSNGLVCSRVEYKEGWLHGKYAFFDDHGHALINGEYSQGEPTGRWVFRDVTGSIVMDLTMDEQSQITWNNATSSKRSSHVLVLRREQGHATSWTFAIQKPGSEELSQLVYDGPSIEFSAINRGLTSAGMWKDGQRDGTWWQVSSVASQLLTRDKLGMVYGTYAAGVRTGTWVSHFLNGQLAEICNLLDVDGKEVTVGEFKSWFDNGQPEMTGQFSNSGKKLGLWRVWVDDGKLISERTYE